MRVALAVALIAASSLSAPAQPAPRATSDVAPTAYVGGRWFDGERFVPRDTTWAARGVFVDARPPGVTRTVELAGRYVVPPYGDAHTHMLSDAYQGPRQAAAFEREGVLYALVVTDRYSWAADVMDRFDGPASIDVAYSHGGWTSPRTHPVQVYEWQALGLVGRELTPANRRAIQESRRAADDAYFEVASLADLDARWSAFLSHQPDVVKVYLADAAAERPLTRSGITGAPEGRGLAPDVLRALVARARAAGLRVFAHVETGGDVELAVDAGVDGFVHLPGYARADGADALYEIDEATARAMARRGVVMTPTSVLSQNRIGRPAREALAADLHRRQLRALHALGVPIALGADRWNTTSRAEADFMVAASFFPPATVLDLWTRVTPRVIFPDRSIGVLSPGHEASFLALACDPLADWSCTAQIAHREKQGHDLDMGATAAAWRQLDVETFAAAPRPTDGPLLRGLKALADADFAAADRALATALAAAPDSLRPFVRARLAESAREQFRWADAVAYSRPDRPDVDGATEAGFARFPAPSMRLDAPETTVPYDGLRIPVAVNGAPARAVVDTGAPGTGIGRGLAERLGLRIDTTAAGRSVVPSMDLALDTYAVLIDSVQVGAATLYNVPATVGWTERESADEPAADEPADAAGDDEIFLGANILRHLAGGLRYGYADSTFTIVRDVAPSDAPPAFLIDDGSAPVVPVTVAGQAANAIVDTGNQISVYLARGAVELAEAPVSREISGTTDGGFAWSQTLYRLPFEIPGHPPGAHEAYEGDFLFAKEDPVVAVLGKPIWAGGTLAIDFVNRRLQFEPAALSLPAAP